MSINRFNWNDLKFFLLVVRNDSLAKAALRLGVTHSTVFRRINSLETDLGMKLFSKTTEGYQLTSPGLDFLKHVERVAKEIDLLQRYVESSSNGLSGEINITAPHSFAYTFLPQYIADFQLEYPNIEINIVVSDDDICLRRNDVDLAIRATSKPPDYLIGERLFRLNWSAFASASYTEKYGVPSNCDELFENHRLIAGLGEQLKLKAFAWIEENVKPGNVACRCNDLISVSRIAEVGVGICLLPDDQSKPGLIRLFTLPGDIKSDIWVLMHPDLRECRRINLFRKYIINKFRQEAFFAPYISS